MFDTIRSILFAPPREVVTEITQTYVSGFLSLLLDNGTKLVYNFSESLGSPPASLDKIGELCVKRFATAYCYPIAPGITWCLDKAGYVRGEIKIDSLIEVVEKKITYISPLFTPLELTVLAVTALAVAGGLYLSHNKQ